MWAEPGNLKKKKQCSFGHQEALDKKGTFTLFLVFIGYCGKA